MPEASYSLECVEGGMKTTRSIAVIEALTNDARNDARRVLYALLTGTKLRRPAARSAWQSRGSSENPRGTLKEATELKHEEFAERAGRRLEAVADRLEGDAGRLGIAFEAVGHGLQQIGRAHV